MPTNDNGVKYQQLLTTIVALSIRADRPEQTLDPDQTPQNAAFDQGLLGLSFVQKF